MNCDVYKNYTEVNLALDLTGDRALSNDTNAEDPIVIVGVRKWSWDNGSEEGPEWPCVLFGLLMVEHVKVYDKYDVFIYTR